MIGAWILCAGLAVGAGLGPPSPRVDPGPGAVAPGPVEGPAAPGSERDPETETETETEPSGPPGIELRPRAPEHASDDVEVPPPPGEGPMPDPDQASSGAPGEVWFPDPGTAPADGSGAFVTAGVLIPVAAFTSVALLREQTLSREDRIGIIVAGVGMEAIGVAGLGLGLHRRLKLRRWAIAYRVRPTPQGGGLLAAGGYGLTAGLTLVPLGLWILARGGSVPVGASLTAVGAVSLGLIAPLGINFGARRRNAYQASGGWVRPPVPEVPQVQLSPRVLMVPGGAGFAVAGRF